MPDPDVARQAAGDATDGSVGAGPPPTVMSRNREVRFFGVLRESPALHFYLMQFVAFGYLAYRFLSRNYTVFGQLPDTAYIYPRVWLNEWFPVPPQWFITGQFIYAFIPRPGPEVVAVIQWVVVACCVLGILGIVPRLAALVAFALALHVTGMLQASHADVDGGSLVLCLLLILVISPSTNFYGIRKPFRPLKRSIDHHWPVFLLFLTVGTFYTLSGVHKLIDIGPLWPFQLHLERLAGVAIEESLFTGSRLRVPWVAALMGSPVLSAVSGMITLIGEIGFISILWLPRYRLFFAWSMITLHVLVYHLAAINFIGSSAVILLCLDWNALVRRATIFYDGDCGFCKRSMDVVRRYDWGKLLTIRTLQSMDAGRSPLDPEVLKSSMGLLDENGEVYYGADAFEQLASRCWSFLPFALLMKVPGAIYIARWVYAWVARNRRRLGGPNSQCELPS
jgi:predicted DCC family thiol-disulfide oxidoreductase YuxK